MFNSLLATKPGAEPLTAAFRACRTHFIWAAFFSALVNLLYLTPTLYMMQVYDRVVPTGGIKSTSPGSNLASPLVSPRISRS